MPTIFTRGAASARGFGLFGGGTLPNLWSWGYNSYGQLGLGNTTAFSSPKAVGSLANWATVSIGRQHTLAVKTDGTLWSWGNNGFGKLGLGNATNYSSPKQIGALTTWATVALGPKFSIAIKTDGTLWALGGYNYYGSLGLGNRTSYNSPKQVGALTTWATVDAGSYFSVAIKTDGTMWSWGANGLVGRLGLGDSGAGIVNARSSPTQIGALTNWSKVATGYTSSQAIKTDGTMWSWGSGYQGRLGLGNSVPYSSPKQVGALTNWSKVDAGNQHSLAVKTDGTLWSWGYGNGGRLGLGNTTTYSSPVQVGALTTWATVSAGHFSSLATTTA